VISDAIGSKVKYFCHHQFMRFWILSCG